MVKGGGGQEALFSRTFHRYMLGSVGLVGKNQGRHERVCTQWRECQKDWTGQTRTMTEEARDIHYKKEFSNVSVLQRGERVSSPVLGCSSGSIRRSGEKVVQEDEQLGSQLRVIIPSQGDICDVCRH